jgi:uncharacterized membrane protein (DUF106 family)
MLGMVFMQLYNKSLSGEITSLRQISFEGYVLLFTMENYVNGAIIQWERIQSMRIKCDINFANRIREIEEKRKELEEIHKIGDLRLQVQKLNESLSQNIFQSVIATNIITPISALYWFWDRLIV